MSEQSARSDTNQRERHRYRRTVNLLKERQVQQNLRIFREALLRRRVDPAEMLRLEAELEERLRGKP